MADPTDGNETSDQDQDTPRGLRARIEEAEQRAAEAEQRAAASERGLAIARARLDGLSDKQLRALDATHEGEMTPDALRATATELGFVSESTQPDQPAAQPAPRDRDHSAEAEELAALTGSHAEPGTGTGEGTTQDQVNQTIKSFETEKELTDWMYEMHRTQGLFDNPNPYPVE